MYMAYVGLASLKDTSWFSALRDTLDEQGEWRLCWSLARTAWQLHAIVLLAP